MSARGQPRQSPADVRPLGATVVGSQTEFRVWAPFARRVDVLLAKSRKTTRLELEDDGVFSGSLEAPVGTDYFFRLDGLVRDRRPLER